MVGHRAGSMRHHGTSVPLREERHAHRNLDQRTRVRCSTSFSAEPGTSSRHGPHRPLGSPRMRQHVDSGLPQQGRRDNKPAPPRDGVPHSGIHPPTQHDHQGSPPRGSGQHGGRGLTGIRDGSLWVDAHNALLSEGDKCAGHADSGPFRVPNDSTGPTILLAHPLPRTRVRRRLCSPLGQRGALLDFPAMAPVAAAADFQQDRDGQRESDRSRPMVDLGDLVANGAGATGGTPTGYLSREGHAGTEVGMVPRACDDLGRDAVQWRCWQEKGIPIDAQRFMVAAIAPSTTKSYSAAVGWWVRWCGERAVDSMAPGLGQVMEYLVERCDAVTVVSLRQERSALSGHFSPIFEEKTLRDTPKVAAMLKGMLVLNPLRPVKRQAFNPNLLVQACCRFSADYDTMDLGWLADKVATLFLLGSRRRPCTLTKTSYESIEIGRDGKWHASELNPKERAGAATPYSFVASNSDPSLCLVTAWRAYDARTQTRRKGADSVLLTKQPPYGPPSTQAVSKWVRTVMTAAGLPERFTPKDIRASVTTDMIATGATAEQIVGTLWTNRQTAARYYDRSALPIFGAADAADAMDDGNDDGDEASATPGAAADTVADVPL
ncbi:hypothetical protein BC828DRAFT_71908 [Blastocladiella britannica]|nr:hypothetical protein BC828DRAFT_71908 [Blastocladiella britannica]